MTLMNGVPPASGSDPVRIPLGKSGRVALVDACDAERVLQFRWRLKAKKSQPGKVYAQRSLPRAIDLSKATWTNRNEAVTCARCIAAMPMKPSSPAIPDNSDRSIRKRLSKARASGLIGRKS